MFAEKSHNYSLHELTTKKKPQLDSNTIIVNHSKIDPSPLLLSSSQSRTINYSSSSSSIANSTSTSYQNNPQYQPWMFILWKKHIS